MKKIGVVLGALVAIVAVGGSSFLIGMKVEENRIRQNPAALFQGQVGGPQGEFRGQFPGVVGTPQPGGEGMPDRGGTMGTIKAVEGDTLVISTEEGEIDVHTTDTTLIEKYVTTGVGDLGVGEQVIVSGSRNDDGSVTARSIRSLGALQPPQSDGQ